jgi:hypothetical protein
MIVHAQAGDSDVYRQVDLDGVSGPSTDPIDVIGVKEGVTPIAPGVPFTAGDDWLKKLSLTMKNVTGKQPSPLAPRGSPISWK